MPVFVVLFGVSLSFLIPLLVEKAWRCHSDAKVEKQINVSYPQWDKNFVFDFEEVGKWPEPKPKPVKRGWWT